MRKTSTIKIGANIQKIRKSHGYTQERLAEAIEVSTRYVSDIEQGKSNPSYEVLIRFCNLFKIGLDEIFSEYLNTKKCISKNHYLDGFSALNEKDKETIEHLIMFFNKSKNEN